jgi:trehalose-phosphatase
MIFSTDQITERLLAQDRLWLFLDYDGTLADFAPTPDQVSTDPEIVSLVKRLTMCPGVQVAVISGRPLSQVRQLLPVSNILLAGTYGAELQTPDGEIIQRAERIVIRPVLEQLKPIWQKLISKRAGFFIEDKGWALALHARFANEIDANQVLSAACASVAKFALSGEFRVLHGQRFLEVGPAIAQKGRTVDYVLDRFAWPGALPVYLGDDDQDEDAFATIRAHHGVALLVAALRRTTLADAQLTSPQAARDWLNQLAERMSAKAPP